MTKIVILIVITVAAIRGYIAWNHPSASLRYETTGEVEADGQLYSVSSVHEVTIAFQSTIANAPPVRPSSKRVPQRMPSAKNLLWLWAFGEREIAGWQSTGGAPS